ncbi:MAG TPA: hypothetical protein VN641_11630 [Urbifossiella sp.]|nr:hypothetical protein [Urbifossiella sp.]
MSMLRLAVLFAFGFLATVSAVYSDDAKAPEKSGSLSTTKPSASTEKMPDFTGYVWVGRRETEVVKADDESITVRVFWPKITASRSRGGRSMRGGRSSMSPFMTRQPNVKVTWEHTDHKVPYLPESLVRVKTLPHKLDDTGKRGFYSEKEQTQLKAPLGVPGYQAAKADITPGTIIDLHLIRDRSIAANKVTDSDMRVKYAIILRHDPNPPKDIANGTAGSPPKKKK